MTHNNMHVVRIKCILFSLPCLNDSTDKFKLILYDIIYCCASAHVCRNRCRNSITSREHAFTKMCIAPKLFKRKSVPSRAQSIAARGIRSRLCRRAHCVVGVGRRVRRTFAPPFHRTANTVITPLHRSHPSTAHSVSCFSISFGCGTRARARAYLLLTDTHDHTYEHARSYVHIIRSCSVLIIF